MSSNLRTSWTLVLGAAAGEALDREAFSVRYAPVIRSYLAARWHTDAEHDRVLDATQDVMIECFKSNGALARVDPNAPGGFRAYLYGVVRNVALVSERRHARRREVSTPDGLDAETLAADEASLSLVFDRAFARTIMRQARELMARRSVRSAAAEERFRTLALQFESGQPPRELAARLAVPVERIYEQLKEGRREYRQALLDVMRGLHPTCDPSELEDRCIELLQRLA